jgi:hypothetical protein
MQQSVATEGIKKDYVTMAIGILKDEKITDAELRGWALSVVRKNSPVALSDQLQTKIVMGALASIPSGLWFPPTKTIMEPPDKAKAFPLKQWEAGGLTDKELAVGWVESAQIAELNAIKLRGLQQYVRALEKVNNEYKAQRLERSSKKLTEELQKEKEGK